MYYTTCYFWYLQLSENGNITDGLFPGDLVEGPKGKCIIKDLPKVEIEEMEQSEGKRKGDSIVLDCNIYRTDIKRFFHVGDKVKCKYGGLGHITKIRQDGIYVVRLENWALAQG